MPLLNNSKSSLIQSIQCDEFHVKYTVDATLEYQPYCPPQQPINTKTRSSVLFSTSPPQPITIVRIPIYDDGTTFLTNDCMLASIDSRKQANQWCQYHVKVDKRYAAISSMLSLSVHLAPLVQGLKLTHVSMQIIQHFTISNNSQSQTTSSRAPIPLECHYQSTPTETGGSLYEGEFQFKIPSNTKTLEEEAPNPAGLVPSIETNPVSNIKVSHHLLVNLTLSYPKSGQDGIVRQARRLLTFQCDFDLLHPCMADHISDKLLRLPAYDTPSIPDVPPQQKQQQQYTRIAKELLHCRLQPLLPPPPPPLLSPPLYDHAIELPPAVI
ncbi:hypothetical protein BC941DRAFT_474187 [Chlamydoabsidia padenii]|nr:hypothetical protein BC941DRAFT_474187 [Chlamydoabsidia padenii]